MSIGSAIKKVRKEKGVSQKDLSEHTGIHRVYISTIESGRRIPKEDMLRKILKSMNVNYLEFIISEAKEHEKRYQSKELTKNV